MIDIDRVRGRIKQLVEYLQAGKQSSSFTAPFSLEKIEHLVKIILTTVKYNGSLVRVKFFFNK
jgi:hypothetical protein